MTVGRCQTYCNSVGKEFRKRFYNRMDQFGTLGASTPQAEQLSKGFNSIWNYDGENVQEEEKKRAYGQQGWNLNKFDAATKDISAILFH
uniref:Uncharacterized protein n=1 Tax=Ditylenchus dipsaci TaxID=166011 RepID=A0A915CXT2_9BILA